MKPKEKRKHLESKYFIKTARMSGGPWSTQEDVPQPQSFMETQGCQQAAGENASTSEYFSCVSLPSKLSHHDEDGFHQLQQNVSYLGDLNMPVSQSTRKWKIMEGHTGGPWSTQEDVPQHQSFMETQGCQQAAGENASTSEYFSCVSSPSKLSHHDEDGIKETPVPKDLVQMDMSSDYLDTSSSSHSSSNKESGLRKIYYMRVQMKRGVAVLYHTEFGWEPPSKRIKMEKMIYTTAVHRNAPLSHTSGENLLNDPEPRVDSPAQEKREKAGWCAAPSTPVFYRRVPLQRPLDSGFRCLACCHVFASLAALQQHVEHGVQEGFSCHLFHRAMARLKKRKRKNKKLVKSTLSCQEEK
ncbi:protein FAM170A-like [Pipistrellus kuhlii]|uniref:protein FAM170A-like n=1 Tax=Pipistrellus kuhlii TaxID=59472 RepID=UPI00174F70A5|nr:protein FAM170A-like [Pipistrellus kuhlii]